MPGLGLQFPAAVQSLDDLVRQRMLDRLAAEDRAEKIRQFNVQAQERERASRADEARYQEQIGMQGETNRLMREAQIARDADLERNRQRDDARTLAGQLTGGTLLTPESAGGYIRQGAIPSERFEEAEIPDPEAVAAGAPPAIAAGRRMLRLRGTPQEDRTRTFSTPRFGVNREAIARAVYGRDFDALEQHEAANVLQREADLVRSLSYGRGMGTGQARFDTPIDIGGAQRGGVPVGTTPRDLSGQAVPTIAQADRRRSVENLDAELTHIQRNLISALPKQGELGAYAPGAWLAIKRRTPEGRNAVAALESAVNNIVNVVARSVGEQRGTQTEKDAERAEAAIVNLRDQILRGDTQESATTRINETLKILRGILGRLPASPSPAAPASGAPGLDPYEEFLRRRREPR